MKTWEMIKALTEDPSKVFERVGDKVRFKLSNKIDAGQVVGHYISGLNTSYENIKLDDEWELVRKPVDFMTAISSGKNIRYESWGSYDTVSSVLHILSDKILSTAVMMINGKWLIE